MRSNKTLNFPAKAKTAFLLLTATGITVHAAKNELFPEPVQAAFHAVTRSSRAISTIALNAADYKYSLRGMPENSEDYRRELSEVHLRSAKRILRLCQANKGFYAKAGQFVAALPQVPKEYSSTLATLQDQAVPCNFKAVKEVLIRNLGPDFSEVFLSFDEQPIAAASIAQVHHAVLKDNQEVAVKVQYPGLDRKMRIDITTMSFLSKSVSSLFPEYRFGWLVSEFTQAISSELENRSNLDGISGCTEDDIILNCCLDLSLLDFIQEARNSETTARNFKDNILVRVPSVYWELTTSQVLTMQFYSGRKVDDVAFLKEMRINPIKVAQALVEVFAEMIFIHGFVHGDLHSGNILVSPEGSKGFSLVLLDHGIYKKLDETFRQDYCELWKAMILLDSHKIQLLGERFGVGMYSRYLPVIFTGRTVSSKTGLGGGMSTEEKRNLKQDLKSLRMEDISSFMESLPPDFLTILRTDGLLRSIIRKLGAPQQVRLVAYAKYAIYGLSAKSNPESVSSMEVTFSRLKGTMRYLQLWLILGILQLHFWLEKVKQFIYTFTREIFSVVVA